MILKCGRVRGRIVPSQQDWKLKQDRWGIEAKTEHSRSRYVDSIEASRTEYSTSPFKQGYGNA